MDGRRGRGRGQGGEKRLVEGDGGVAGDAAEVETELEPAESGGVEGREVVGRGEEDAGVAVHRRQEFVHAGDVPTRGGAVAGEQQAVDLVEEQNGAFGRGLAESVVHGALGQADEGAEDGGGGFHAERPAETAGQFLREPRLAGAGRALEKNTERRKAGIAGNVVRDAEKGFEIGARRDVQELDGDEGLSAGGDGVGPGFPAGEPELAREQSFDLRENLVTGHSGRVEVAGVADRRVDAGRVDLEPRGEILDDGVLEQVCDPVAGAGRFPDHPAHAGRGALEPHGVRETATHRWIESVGIVHDPDLDVGGGVERLVDRGLADPVRSRVEQLPPGREEFVGVVDEDRGAVSSADGVPAGAQGPEAEQGLADVFLRVASGTNLEEPQAEHGRERSRRLGLARSRWAGEQDVEAIPGAAVRHEHADCLDLVGGDDETVGRDGPFVIYRIIDIVERPVAEPLEELADFGGGNEVLVDEAEPAQEAAARAEGIRPGARDGVEEGDEVAAQAEREEASDLLDDLVERGVDAVEQAEGEDRALVVGEPEHARDLFQLGKRRRGGRFAVGGELPDHAVEACEKFGDVEVVDGGKFGDGPRDVFRNRRLEKRKLVQGVFEPAFADAPQFRVEAAQQVAQVGLRQEREHLLDRLPVEQGMGGRDAVTHAPVSQQPHARLGVVVVDQHLSHGASIRRHGVCLNPMRRGKARGERKGIPRAGTGNRSSEPPCQTGYIALHIHSKIHRYNLTLCEIIPDRHDVVVCEHTYSGLPRFHLRSIIMY